MDKLLANVGYHATVSKPRANYVALKMPRGNYRKTLAVCFRVDDGRPHALAYITWRKSDNHKQLWLRASDNSTVLGPDMPQTRKTNMSDLASILGVPVSRLTLKNKTGYSGPVRPIDGPKFTTSSIAGGFNLV